MKTRQSILDKIGTFGISNSELEYQILEHKPLYFKVRFTETKNEKWIKTDKLKIGKLVDELSTTVCGIGKIGYCDKGSITYRKAYNIWTKMLGRVELKGDFFESYQGVEISKDWLDFSIFQKDIEQICGYNKWLNKRNIDLDKDLFGNGKLYSKDTCCFIEHKLNTQIRAMDEEQLIVLRRDIRNEGI